MPLIFKKKKYVHRWIRTSAQHILYDIAKGLTYGAIQNLHFFDENIDHFDRT